MQHPAPHAPNQDSTGGQPLKRDQLRLMQHVWMKSSDPTLARRTTLSMKRFATYLPQLFMQPHPSFQHASQKKGKKRFSTDPELRDVSTRCKSAWKEWKKAGRPSQGPEHEEKKRLSRLTKQCANKCRVNLDRKS